MKLYQQIAQTLQALHNCRSSRTFNAQWEARHVERLAALVKENLPSGSGFDNGTSLDDSSNGEKLVFSTAFHHMDDGGFYDGWTEHKVTVSASLVHGFSIKVSGRNRNDIKYYIADCFSAALSCEVQP